MNDNDDKKLRLNINNDGGVVYSHLWKEKEAKRYDDTLLRWRRGMV